MERTQGKAAAGEPGMQGSGWQTGQYHIHVVINWEGQLGSETDYATQGSSAGKYSLKISVKTCGGCSHGRNSQPHRRASWRDPLGPRMYTTPPTPPGNQHQKGPS